MGPDGRNSLGEAGDVSAAFLMYAHNLLMGVMFKDLYWMFVD